MEKRKDHVKDGEKRKDMKFQFSSSFTFRFPSLARWKFRVLLPQKTQLLFYSRMLCIENIANIIAGENGIHL